MMNNGNHGIKGMSTETLQFYREAFTILEDAGIPFLVGGAYGLNRCAGIVRHTKDLDVFVRPEDAERTLAVFQVHGFRTEMPFPHWLGKAWKDRDFVDVIFSSGNGITVVDDDWFVNSSREEIFGTMVQVCPTEEMIWSKSFILERERYDGADVAHLIRGCSEQINWPRLIARFGEHWRVLLSHLVLFGFIYPAERERIPAPVLQELMQRMEDEMLTAAPKTRVCQGTLISREQYLTDINEWGYTDARRINDNVHMTPDEIKIWTDAIEAH